MLIPSQDKIFKYLTVSLAIIVAGLLVRELFFKPPQIAIPSLNYPVPQIDIKTEIFDEFKMQELTAFEEITAVELAGRKNPFEPYSLEEYQLAQEEYYAALAAATTTFTTIPFATSTTEE